MLSNYCVHYYFRFEANALAKVANRIAKKFPELGGVYVIDTVSKLENSVKLTTSIRFKLTT